MYNVGSNIARNVGLTPNPLSADAQTAMTNHPYATDVGNVIGGTAVAIPLAVGAGAAAPLVGLGGTGVLAGAATGAATGAAQNVLTGNPDQPWYQRAGIGAGLGAGFGALGNKVGQWFGAGKSIEPDVAAAAKNLQQEGVTNINLENLPGGNIKAMGATPTYQQSGQIDNSASRILGDDVPNWNKSNINGMKTRLGGAVSNAANSGQINAQSGGAFDQALTQVQQFAKANGVGSQLDPIVNQIRSKIGSNGVISGQDFDNLVGNGSVLHDLVGDDNPYVKQAAQALDRTMDAGFQASSPPGAYDDWVDARTKYRMLMGAVKSVLPNGHINPTTLFNSIQNRFTDLKGVPISSDPLVGRMGQFASDIRTLFGGGPPPSQAAAPGLLQTLGIGSAGGAAASIVPEIMSGNFANPENYLSPAALGAGAVGVGSALARYAGQAYQRSRPFVNALINAGGAPVANPLAQYPAAIGTQNFPQRQQQPQ
jgi:hypothetical protein